MTTVKIESFVIIGVKCSLIHSFISQKFHIFKDFQTVKLFEVLVWQKFIKNVVLVVIKRNILEELHATLGIFDALAVLQDWIFSNSVVYVVLRDPTLMC